MFDQIKSLVQEHLGGNQQVSQALPAGREEEVHDEIAGQITQGLASHAASNGGGGGLLDMLKSGLASGNPLTNAIEGGLVSSLGSKFGLPPMVTGAIAAALPGLLQKFAHKVNDPNDQSITPDSLNKSLSTGGLGSLGSLFGK